MGAPPDAARITGLPMLCDGQLSVRVLKRWSGEFGAISARERYPARAFVEWREDNLPVSGGAIVRGSDHVSTLGS